MPNLTMADIDAKVARGQEAARAARLEALKANDARHAVAAAHADKAADLLRFRGPHYIEEAEVQLADCARLLGQIKAARRAP